MIVEKTPAGLVGYITPGDLERLERQKARAAELEALAAAVIRRGEAVLAEAAACIAWAHQGGSLNPQGGRLSGLLNADALGNSKTVDIRPLIRTRAKCAPAPARGFGAGSVFVTLQNQK